MSDYKTRQINNKGMVICGAKTRSGKPCANTAVKGNGRCRMHGGKSEPAGIAHTRYKNGRYSKFRKIGKHAAAFEQSIGDPNALVQREEIATLTARIDELLSIIADGGAIVDAKMLLRLYRKYKNANHAGDIQKASVHLAEFEQALESASQQQYSWDKVSRVIDNRRRVVESERKRAIEGSEMMKTAHAIASMDALTTAVTSAVMQAVSNPDEKKRVLLLTKKAYDEAFEQ